MFARGGSSRKCGRRVGRSDLSVGLVNNSRDESFGAVFQRHRGE